VNYFSAILATTLLDFAFDLVSSVAVKQAKCNLRKYLPYYIFSYMLLSLSAAPYNLREVALFAVFHYDVDLVVLFVDYAVQISDYMRMIELSKYVDLLYELHFSFLTHLAILKLFPHHDLTVTLPPDLAHLSERTFLTLMLYSTYQCQYRLFSHTNPSLRTS
jgi:hypothetical protein